MKQAAGVEFSSAPWAWVSRFAPHTSDQIIARSTLRCNQLQTYSCRTLCLIFEGEVITCVPSAATWGERLPACARLHDYPVSIGNT
jgi:hypothetical protein